MTCKVVMDLVELYNEGIVSQESAETIREHLKNCPECSKYYQKYETMKEQRLPDYRYPTQRDISYAEGKRYVELSRKLRKHRYMRIAGASAAIGAGSIMLMVGIILTCKGNGLR